MKEKNGFTLIELLAIIIILGIIAVITVPIISKILKDSKKNLAMDSAYGYISAVNKLYYTNSMNDLDDITDGTYSVSELKTMGVSVSGTEPSEGWVQVVDGDVVSYSLKIGDFVVTKYGSSDVVCEKGEVQNLNNTSGNNQENQNNNSSNISSIFESIEPSTDGAKYITDAIEIYYNPTTGQKCNSSDSVSTTGTTTGCLHWYLYSVKGNYANMILDHNITEAHASSGVWALEADYTAGLTPIMDGETVTGYEITEGTGSKATSAGITYPNTVTSFPKYGSSPGQSENARGPVTVLNTLKSLTSGWTSTETPKVPNSTSTNEHIITKDKNDNKYQIDYTGYKARLITKEEIVYLGCSWSSNSCPEWMIKGTYGENSSTYASIYGYWTSSSFVTSYADVHRIDKNGKLTNNCADLDVSGVRPVITVLIDDVLS